MYNTHLGLKTLKRLYHILFGVTDNLPFHFNTVTLSADAVPAPGGYVVPVGGNITFTCNHSLPEVGVLWEVNLRVPGAIASLTASAGLPHSLPQVTSPDTLPSANPASFTIHNITSENNSSFVECYEEGLGRSNAIIIVEGKGLIYNHTKHNDTYVCTIILTQRT